MVQFIYIDETGSVGKGANKQPLLTLVAAMVHEDNVQPLAKRMSTVAMGHLGWVPANFEFHGNEVWGGQGFWKGKTPAELIATYEAAVGLLDELDISIAFSSIDKVRLNARYNGGADQNAYRLALQFLLEKVDKFGGANKVIVADEAKEEQLSAVAMVADLQDWGGGEVPGARLKTVIDSLHFVRSHASPGVQLADMCAYAIQRHENGWDKHPDAKAAIARVYNEIIAHRVTYRQPWPT